MPTAEELLKADVDAVVAYLLENEPTLATASAAVMTKALVLAGASEIEVEFQDHIVAFYREAMGTARHAAAFVEKKAVKRQYHTYFVWEGTNGNSFYGLFGAQFRGVLQQRTRDDPAFDDAVKAFLELGRLRNEIVHQNFAAYALGKTADEVHDLCLRARRFVDALPAMLRAEYPEGD